MRKRDLGIGALLGAALTAPLIGMMFLAAELADLPLVPFDLFDWITRVLPGPLVTFGIDLMIDSMLLVGVSVANTAKTAEQISAVMMFFALGIVAGAIFYALMASRRLKTTPAGGLLLGAIFGLPLTAISLAISQSSLNPLVNIAWLALLFLDWGLALAIVARRLLRSEAAMPSTVAVPASEASASEDGESREVARLDRRQFLIRLGASTATITVASSGLAAVLARSERQRAAESLAEAIAQQPVIPTPTPGLSAAGKVFEQVKGTRPELTPLADHYKVFLRTQPTNIEEESWVLPITGLVDNPLTLSLADIRENYESRDQYVTITCISGRVGTGLIGTTLWTGVSLAEVLADAGLQPEARYLQITSGDGFYETVDLELVKADERIMLCYAWNGMPLPVDHGFPLRIWIPDLYGMKQPKWITGFEITDEYKKGYWVDRNWDEVAQVRTTSVIDMVAVDDIVEDGGSKFVPVGGIAYSGARGISKVEVRVDEGPWQEAQLKEPLSETTWVLWRYDWPFAEGNHNFEVRCAEADGTPQIEESSSNRPSGATGIHNERARL